MAESINIRVSCHACGYLISGSARYGQGHYIQQGVEFEFIATGKIKTDKGRRVKGEMICICPKCGVKNKHLI